uniref:Uncharacterized protein n=1 Tax=Oryza meridionalis TaxID=40149 RepID=A0A0E0EA72_9ORYZ
MVSRLQATRAREGENSRATKHTAATAGALAAVAAAVAAAAAEAPAIADCGENSFKVTSRRNMPNAKTSVEVDALPVRTNSGAKYPMVPTM